MAFSKTNGLLLNAEIKGNLTKRNADGSKGTITTAPAKQFVAAVKKYEMVSNLVMSSDSHAIVKRIQSRRSGIATADIEFGKPETKQQISSYGSYYEPTWKFFTPGNVRTIHKLGVKVIIWPAKTAADFERSYSTAADIILSDDPLALRTWLGSQS